MNIHPILVHFPIALLTIYSFFELLRFRRLLSLDYWFYTKALFLFLGLAGAWLAVSTGELGLSLFRDRWEVISLHENFADLTLAIFGLLAFGYATIILNRWLAPYLSGSRYESIWHKLVWLGRRLLSGYLVIPLALTGFIAISITGALGGIIVYGPNADFVTILVAKIFGL